MIGAVGVVLLLTGCGSDYLTTVSKDVAAVDTNLNVSLACAAELSSQTDPDCPGANATTRRAESVLLRYVDTAQAPAELQEAAQSLANDAMALVANPMTSPTGLVEQSSLDQQMGTIVRNMDDTEGKA